MSSCPAVSITTASLVERLATRMRVAKQIVATSLASVWTLLLCKAVIGFAAAFDTYLTLKYAESLDVYEQNPLGRWLMDLDHGPVASTQQIAAFVTAKFLGTILVLMTLQGVAFWRVRLAGMLAVPVAAFQLSLVAHLLFAHG